MILTVGMLLAKCVYSMQRVPIPRYFFFTTFDRKMLRWPQKCKVKSLADG